MTTRKIDEDDDRGHDRSDASLAKEFDQEIEEERKRQRAYQYLCYLEEAKVWIEACLKEKLPCATELEEAFRNGVYLAKLAHFISPETVPLKKIYDRDFKSDLCYRHIDNINLFMYICKEVGLHKDYIPETTDIYDRKNVPKLIYCIHLLSGVLSKSGLAPELRSLYGEVQFSEEQVFIIIRQLEEAEKREIPMPDFGNIRDILEKEEEKRRKKMSKDKAARDPQNIVQRINRPFDKGTPEETHSLLLKPEGTFPEVFNGSALLYHDGLRKVKHKVKVTLVFSVDNIVQRINRSLDKGTPEETHSLLLKPEGKFPEVFNRSALLYHDGLRKVKQQLKERGVLLLSYEVICQHLKVLSAVVIVNEAVEKKTPYQLIRKLENAELTSVEGGRCDRYLTKLISAKQEKAQKHGAGKGDLTQADLQQCVDLVNKTVKEEQVLEDIVQRINRSLDKGTPEKTHSLLLKPEGKFPEVFNRSALLYHDGLRKVKQQLKERGVPLLSYEVICKHLKVLSAVVIVNETVEKKTSDQLIKKLENAELTSVEGGRCDRYLSKLISAKQGKAQKHGAGKGDLTQADLQQCVDLVNKTVKEEQVLEDIVQRINRSLDKGTPEETHSLLLKPEGKFPEVFNRSALLYHDWLRKVKQQLKERGVPLLSYEVICKHLKVLSAVVIVNETIEKKTSDQLIKKLENAELTLVDGGRCDRYLSKLISAKLEKAQKYGAGKGDLTQADLQQCVDLVNKTVKEEQVLEDIVQRINRSLDKGTPEKTHNLLLKPEGKFPEVFNRSALLYHDWLRKVKRQLKERGVPLLSYEVICKHLKVLSAVVIVNETIEKKTSDQLIKKLENAELTSVEGGRYDRYLTKLILAKQEKAQEYGAGKGDLTQVDLQQCVDLVNKTVKEEQVLEDIVLRINRSLDKATPEETHNLLLKPEGKFPEVFNRSALLYHDGLRKVKQQLKERGVPLRVSYEVICKHLKVLSAVVIVNETIEKKTSDQLIKRLENAELTSVDGGRCDRYLTKLISAKQEKAQSFGAGKDDLTQADLQECVDLVNTIVEEEQALHPAVIAINKAIDIRIAEKTLKTLCNPSTQLKNVLCDIADDYQLALYVAKSRKRDKTAQASMEFPGTDEVDNNNAVLLTHPEIQEIINEVYENLDETLTERIMGLTEMFPEYVRRGACAASRGIGSAFKWLYNFTGRTIWVVSTSFVLLAVPVIVEVERVHADEAQLRQQRQILLGPGSVGGRMELAGYPVLPPNKSTTAASDGYNRMFKAGSS